MTQTVICMKWGTLYGAAYANRLYAMVARNTVRPLRFVCFTDDATGLRPEIEVRDLPPISLPGPVANLPWRKMALWNETLGDVEGQVLFFDLDLLITGSIDAFFDYLPQDDFVVIHNWTTLPKPIGNTSCFRFRVGSNPHLFEAVERDFPKVYKKYRIEQTLISYEAHSVAFWPDEWCLSFKHSLLPRWPMRLFVPAQLPSEAKVVAFTGKPDVHDVIAGEWPAPWYKKFYKTLKRPDWVEEHWRD
jgi:hypothetical protein